MKEVIKLLKVPLSTISPCLGDHPNIGLDDPPSHTETSSGIKIRAQQSGCFSSKKDIADCSTRADSKINPVTLTYHLKLDLA